MAPPSAHPSLYLKVLERPYFVTQLHTDSAIPAAFLEALGSAHSERFLSVTRTLDEISIVGEANDALPVTPGDLKWRCIKIAGPMEFGLTGVLSSFTAPLKEAQIPVFAVSTWNTDYILVPIDKINGAIVVLKGDGWIFAES